MYNFEVKCSKTLLGCEECIRLTPHYNPVTTWPHICASRAKASILHQANYFQKINIGLSSTGGRHDSRSKIKLPPLASLGQWADGRPTHSSWVASLTNLPLVRPRIWHNGTHHLFVPGFDVMSEKNTVIKWRILQIKPQHLEHDMSGEGGESRMLLVSGRSYRTSLAWTWHCGRSNLCNAGDTDKQE
jgi:hypothetical protein